MVLTVSFVLSPVIGLFVTVIGVMRAPRRLGTSVEMPEPHDFAVRAQHRSPSMLPRPSHPAPNVRDDREAPLSEKAGRRGYTADLRFWKSEIFFTKGVDTISENQRISERHLSVLRNGSTEPEKDFGLELVRRSRALAPAASQQPGQRVIECRSDRPAKERLGQKAYHHRIDPR